MKYTDINFNKKTILITGGAGFIGSNLAFYFQNNYPKSKIVVLDSFRSGETFSNGNLKSFGHFKNLLGFKGIVISGDINDKSVLKSLEKNYKFDYIFHQAAISDTTVQEQDLMIKTNVNAYEDLLKIAIKHKANMIYASSAATYGDSDRFEVGYEQPNNAYGFSKVMMDNVTYDYLKKDLDISIVGLKYFNVYGPREFFKNKTASMVVQFGHQILKGLTPKLFEGSDKILRDFIYIEDIIQANIKACTPKKSGVYNVGTGNARSFEDIVNILQKELQINNGKEYIPNPYVGSYQFFTQANIETTTKYLGYEPKFSLEDGIKAYIPEILKLFKEEVK
ncbi:ADP-glyceromanno-heptose 6-epimerase [Aliarcobacter butzleri]|uniref:ADP-L-glycero-D-manno-heptose-6-epimerase n=1 Tax=Aliarcobacter butzleri L351 TaxID=1447259 RepID=A0A837J6H8_9BACT|nr:ADP-glyceromanno-heptose 6-epimerase [Aliarcobacter butzleri]KLE02094.1 ADP-L-glycero-D-manno-heptose-6-epimerase [Aliarcobacter butzleri L351]KLE13713.1 ADP-L-glycero-D-manno-heptose-6-epimerase [Aliarcobacter butzleri L350]MCG3658265.1 ADP-glyceromanno-heptose 6-epimerase [Aliarcobacter butzleri]MCG3670677.1 ADP-glyceromanno-heptose 6-epimerase [Aliarcobacter butzleri]MDN5048395.1 ADP-glyceromanno-heptose 6-epimerase [Aliarcobacter butzleri]